MHTKQHVFLTLPLVLFFAWLQGGCSTPESQERVDTLLCWLRPSCLPQDGHSPSPAPSKEAVTSRRLQDGNTPAPAPRPTKASPSPSLPSLASTAPLKETVASRRPTVCHTSAKVTVTSSTPFVTISYTEPTTKANGQSLTNLAKTTIYYDLGKGLIKYKDVPASGPNGGGTVKEKMSLSVKEGEAIKVTICVTATDSHGREG